MIKINVSGRYIRNIILFIFHLLVNCMSLKYVKRVTQRKSSEKTCKIRLIKPSKELLTRNWKQSYLQPNLTPKFCYHRLIPFGSIFL